MHFPKVFASAALAGSVLGHVPGVVHDFPVAKRNVVEKRAECSSNNLLRALVHFRGNGTEDFCRSYLGGGSGTVIITVPGVTETVDATITETPKSSPETVTEFGTVPTLARRQAEIFIPADISQHANDTPLLTSGCACLLYSTSVVPGGGVITVTGPADASATATATVTIDGTTTTLTSLDTVTIPRSSESTSDPTPTSYAPTATSTGCVTGKPIIGCVFGSAIISADLITAADECPALCEALTNCVAYQIGVNDTGAIAYCETLNVPAADAFDASGSEESAEYCSKFTILDYTCPATGKPLRSRRFRY